MLLAHQPASLERLREPTESDPLRVLVSGCLAGWSCGVDGSDYGLVSQAPRFLSLPIVRRLPFCPEQHALGTPRSTPDIHGGDGFDVLAGRARVLDEHGVDLTDAMVAGARAMLTFATEASAELAILTDSSAACGSQVISDGCRLVQPRRHRWGVGVATAMLLRAGILVVSQRDFLTLAAIGRRLAPDEAPAAADVRDHHHHPWTEAHLRPPHPRARYGVDERGDPGPYESTFEDR